MPSGIYMYYEKFDYIIGNPPYITLYGRRDKKKSEEERAYYLKNYDQFPTTLKNGKINYIMLLIEHGINFLKTGGTLSFIIDVSFFETAYKYCRKYLLNNTRIRRLIFNIQGFDNVASGQIILTIDKIKTESNKVIASADDPVIPADDLNRLALNPYLSVEILKYGGHCGFIENYRFRSSCYHFLCRTA